MLASASWEENWKGKKVKSLNEILHFNRYRKSPLPEIITDVEISKIVGTTYENYNKGTWGQMMKGLVPRRNTDVFPCERYFKMIRDEHDHSQGSKPLQQPIALAKYGEEYVILGGGNHRICHAKFAGISTLRLRVQEYVIDSALVKEELESLHLIEVISKPTPLWERGFNWLFAKLNL